MSFILSILFIACSFVSFLHVRAILRDQCVAGVSLVPTFVFITTNVFEIVYFGRLHDWWPVFGAFAMFVSNVSWTVCVFWFKYREWASRLDETVVGAFSSIFSLDT